MENINRDINFSRRKIVSVILLIVFSLAFIFSCMKNILPIGLYIAGTFGIMTYPLLILLILVELAKFLGFSYTRNRKMTVYLLIAVVSMLFVIHSIATYKQLDKVVGFSSLKSYLALAYGSKLSLVGSFGSLLCGMLAMILGPMGTIAAYVILFTSFVGLFIDFEFYGKYEASVKKIKNKTIRKKVNKSDSKLTPSGEPEYSFNKNSENEEVATITIDENDVVKDETGYSISPTYSEDDVVSTITDEDISRYDDVDEQTPASFDTNVYEEPKYPDVYSQDDTNQSRKWFMEATFGKNEGDVENPTTTVETPFVVPDYDNSNKTENITEISPVIETPEYTNNLQEESFQFPDYNENYSKNGFELPKDDEISVGLDNENQDNSQNDDILNFDDELAKLFGTREDDFVSDEQLKDNYEDLDKRASKLISKSFETNYDVDFGNNANQNENNFNLSQPSSSVVNSNSGLAGINQTSNVDNILNQVKQIPVQNQNIMSDIKPKVPSAGTQNIAKQTGMFGLRYNPPLLSLLTPPVVDKGNYSEEQHRKAVKLEEVLKAFNIPATVVNIVRGPKITRYELSIPLGIPTKKIPTQEADIARALEAKTIVIRAPIPGSPYVGIELENDSFTSVCMRELLESPEFQNSKDPLPITIGKDISGEIVVKSLAKMVHLLIAGSTGSGKSVFIHNIIMSLIYKSSPEDLRLILIDPKRVEFGRYNGLPHLITPEVVMGPEKALNALKWSVKEMDRRYKLMEKAGYNNIVPYNKSELVKNHQFEKFPYIVIIVDELAEVMMFNSKEVNFCLQRLTQLARACGMHLVLAVQRPSVDVITGTIKNNVGSRFAFRLQTGIDSKTMLGTVGAEKLLGKGDMLMQLSDTSSMPRLQAAYATDEEIKAVIDYVTKNNATSYDESISKAFDSDQSIDDDIGASGSVGGGDMVPPKDRVDEYFKEAVKIVMMNEGASISYLQRKLQIGYSRAARIVDQMEERGYIAPSTGSKVRKVTITPEKFKEDFGEDYDSI